jgi:hypothetical protein
MKNKLLQVTVHVIQIVIDIVRLYILYMNPKK